MLWKEQSKGAKCVIIYNKHTACYWWVQGCQLPGRRSAQPVMNKLDWGFTPGPERAQRLPEPSQCQHPPVLPGADRRLNMRTGRAPRVGGRWEGSRWNFYFDSQGLTAYFIWHMAYTSWHIPHSIYCIAYTLRCMSDSIYHMVYTTWHTPESKYHMLYSTDSI